jgi:DNA polymerase III delta subunit
MLYFLYGSDKDKARSKAQSLVDSLLTKKPDASFFKVTEETFNEANFEEYIGGQGLFSNKYIVLADGVLSKASTGLNKETKNAIKDYIVSKLKEIHESDNIFIFRDGEIDKALLAKIEKNAEKVQEFAAKNEVKENIEFNIFSLTDALGRRDKKSLWNLYEQALRKNIEAEQIHGTLFWHMKSLRLAAMSNTAKEAGLNPFVFTKAKTFLKNFTIDEIDQFSKNLVTLYHEARRGTHELETALERWILSI